VSYQLFYWPDIPGRGEFVRLALEEAGVSYRDVARDPDAMAEIEAKLEEESIAHPPFAPPFLIAGNKIIGQTATILLFLGDEHNLAPKAVAGRLWTQQLQLTIADLVAEVHDTHHPISLDRYYEDQKREALLRSESFRKQRIPKFFGWFETVLKRNPKGPTYLVGASISYADLSLFHVVGGLRYAFPTATKRALHNTPHLVGHVDAVAKRPRIKAYLASERRQAFNEDDIFRHYPELDG
jgi:glutathione S-transferase